MKRTLFTVILIVICTLALLLAEGIFSVARWNLADRSIIYQTYKRVVKYVPEDAQPELKLASRDEIETLIPDMINAGVGMGNTPYERLKTERAAINTRTADGCIFSKPFLRKEMTYIRSIEFELFDPPSLFYDEGAELGSRLQEFIDRYAMRHVSYHTNSQGERLTFPTISLQDRVLVAGDSVAIGAMVGDEETLPSALQKRDTARQYVNLGVGGVNAEEIICNLSSAAKRYHGQIKELIYVYPENDFRPSENFGQPEDVVAWLTDYVKREGVEKVKIVYAPSIFNIVPQLTRFRGYRGVGQASRQAETERLRALSRKAGFVFIDIAELAQREAQDRGTSFAALSLFVDVSHLSPYGTAKLADALLGWNFPRDLIRLEVSSGPKRGPDDLAPAP